MPSTDGDQRGGRWTFLTNHARVLLMIARNPEIRLRDVAGLAGITERATQAIVSDLEAAGYLTRTRVGRRNRYTVDTDRRFRHPFEADYSISGLLAIFEGRGSADGAVLEDGAEPLDGAGPGRPAAPGDSGDALPS